MGCCGLCLGGVRGEGVPKFVRSFIDGGWGVGVRILKPRREFVSVVTKKSRLLVLRAIFSGLEVSSTSMVESKIGLCMSVRPSPRLNPFILPAASRVSKNLSSRVRAKVRISVFAIWPNSKSRWNSDKENCHLISAPVRSAVNKY